MAAAATLLLAVPLLAQEGTPPGPGEPASRAAEPATAGGSPGAAAVHTPPSPPPAADHPDGPRVLCAFRAGTLGPEEREALFGARADRGEVTCPGEARASLGERIYVLVENLDHLLHRPPAGEVACRQLVLFLHGAPLEGTRPASCDVESDLLAFDLERTKADDGDWHHLLGEPTGWTQSVYLTVGIDSEFPIVSDVDDFQLVILSPWELGFFVLLSLVVLGVFFRLAVTTPMLKDPRADAPRDRLPYSLARCQMAWWFFLAGGSYLMIWMVLGALDTLPASVLGLIGISSATTLAASAIDGKKKADERQAEAVAAEAQEISHSLAGDTSEASLEARVRGARAVEEARRLDGAVKGPTRGWLHDLLSDGNGISFHRFQVAGWTVLLGLIFVWEVYEGLTMPDFSTTLLGLMGISSGTYLGLKVPERPGR